MENKANIVLYLGNEHEISSIKKKVYEEELHRINEKNSIDHGEFDLAQIYMTKVSDEEIEVGFFIRNALDKEIIIENFPLVIEDNDRNIVAAESFNFKDFGPVPSYTAKPFNIRFTVSKDIGFEENNNYIIKLGKNAKIDAYHSVTTNVENIPEDVEFEKEHAIKEFEKGLKTLKANQLSVHLFRMSRISKDIINCELLFRNGSNSEVPIKKLPLTIVDGEGYIIAKGVFENGNILFTVEPLKSILMEFEVKCSDSILENADLSNYKVIFN